MESIGDKVQFLYASDEINKSPGCVFLLSGAARVCSSVSKKFFFFNRKKNSLFFFSFNHVFLSKQGVLDAGDGRCPQEQSQEDPAVLADHG